MQLLKDEGAAPSPEDEKRREQVIRELKKVMGLGMFGQRKNLANLVPCLDSDMLCFRASLR
jgi:hypothetical protein